MGTGPLAQPVWNEEFSFDVSDIDLAVLVIIAWDYDLMLDDFLGQNAFPVAELSTGWHTIPMLDSSGFIQDGEPCLSCYLDLNIEQPQELIPNSCKQFPLK